MARPTVNRRSAMLLQKLEGEHKFNVVKELIEIYGYNKEVLMNLADKMAKNIAEGNGPLHEMEQPEISMYNACNRNVLDILVRLLSYLYPKLKALEIGAGTGEKITFNINTVPDLKAAGKPEQQPGKVIPMNQG